MVVSLPAGPFGHLLHGEHRSGSPQARRPAESVGIHGVHRDVGRIERGEDYGFGRPHTLPRRPAGADFDDAGGRAADQIPHLQNKQLSSRAFDLSMSNDGQRRAHRSSGTLLVARRLSVTGPADTLGAAVGKDLGQTSPPSTRTSAVARIGKRL